jgi:hypothetical protein
MRDCTVAQHHFSRGRLEPSGQVLRKLWHGNDLPRAGSTYRFDREIFIRTPDKAKLPVFLLMGIADYFLVLCHS